MLEINLKPCPFCGGKAEKRTFINSAGVYVYRVYCPQCQIGTMKHNSMKRACEIWNRRSGNDKG